MTPELTSLALAGLLQAVQFTLFAVPANCESGVGYSSSARDRPPGKPMSGVTLRLQRAMNNHVEGLILFAIAVLVTHLADRSTGLSATLAWTYLGARLLDIPAYLIGLSLWRALIWGLGRCATLGLLILAVI